MDEEILQFNKEKMEELERLRQENEQLTYEIEDLNYEVSDYKEKLGKVEEMNENLREEASHATRLKEENEDL